MNFHRTPIIPLCNPSMTTNNCQSPGKKRNAHRIFSKGNLPAFGPVVINQIQTSRCTGCCSHPVMRDRVSIASDIWLLPWTTFLEVSYSLLWCKLAWFSPIFVLPVLAYQNTFERGYPMFTHSIHLKGCDKQSAVSTRISSCFMKAQRPQGEQLTKHILYVHAQSCHIHFASVFTGFH